MISFYELSILYFVAGLPIVIECFPREGNLSLIERLLCAVFLSVFWLPVFWFGALCVTLDRFRGGGIE